MSRECDGLLVLNFKAIVVFDVGQSETRPCIPTKRGYVCAGRAFLVILVVLRGFIVSGFRALAAVYMRIASDRFIAIIAGLRAPLISTIGVAVTVIVVALFRTGETLFSVVGAAAAVCAPPSAVIVLASAIFAVSA